MFSGIYTKSVLKSMAMFLAFGLGLTSILHSVAAVCEISWTLFGYHANQTKDGKHTDRRENILMTW